MEFNVISYKEAIDFLLPRHYSGRKPPVSFAFGAFNEGVLTAVVTFGIPASPSLCKGVCGEELKQSVIELNRVCCDDDYPEQVSRFVAWCLRQLHNKIVVSYSDMAMGHIGYIYQACNFLYTGMTKSRTDKYTEGNKHSRHYTNDNTKRKVRSSKHRYIFFACDKKTKKNWMSLLRYRVQSYPKGDCRRYKLGDFIEAEVIE